MQIYVVIEHKGPVTEVLMAFEDINSAREYALHLQEKERRAVDIVSTSLVYNVDLEELN